MNPEDLKQALKAVENMPDSELKYISKDPVKAYRLNQELMSRIKYIDRKDLEDTLAVEMTIKAHTEIREHLVVIDSYELPEPQAMSIEQQRDFARQRVQRLVSIAQTKL